MQDRFKLLLEEKKLTATRFAGLIKINPSAMSHILNGRSKPGFDVLDKIAQSFPDVNLNWLISGKGEPYYSSSQTDTQKQLSDTTPVAIENSYMEKEVLTPSIDSSEKMPVFPIPTNKNKKIKRIILFFEDGSFEDYEK